MQRLRSLGVLLMTWLVIFLCVYELTAKSPHLLGLSLPGSWASERAENTTRWRQPTGLLPVDRLLHESQEAVRFYALLAGNLPSPQPR